MAWIGGIISSKNQKNVASNYRIEPRMQYVTRHSSRCYAVTPTNVKEQQIIHPNFF